jgi:MYXO-CTERM domain-containing protein
MAALHELTRMISGTAPALRRGAFFSGTAPALRSGAFLLVVLACAATASVARAYSTPDAYMDRASQGGGGGRWFTGSPADGFGCTVCHSALPEQRHFPVYVAGLPTAGYALAGRQEIVLSWPEFATRWRELRPDPMVMTPAGAQRPAMGLVLELVAESGRGSGVIEIDTNALTPGQLCEKTRPNLAPRLAAKLFQVRAGVEPLVIKPDSNGLLRCEARRLGQRCILSLLSCGAQGMRFTWTAPPTWEGPVWFSAGFVASEALSSTPQQDSVQEISVPIVQAGTPGAVYEQKLQQACAVAAAGAGARERSEVFVVGLAVGAIGLIRRRRRGTRMNRSQELGR